MKNDPFVRVAYKPGTAECVPSNGGLRNMPYEVARNLYLRHRPLPKGWKALGVPYKPHPDINLEVITDFKEQEHEGKIGVRFKAEGKVDGQDVDVTFSISKEQLEAELKVYEAFGGGMRCHIEPILLA